MKITRKIRRAWRRGKPAWAKQYPLKARLGRAKTSNKVITMPDRGSRLRKYGRYLVASVMLVGALASWVNPVQAALLTNSNITAHSKDYAGTIVKNGNTYNIQTQQQSGKAGFNYFNQFELANTDVANLHFAADSRLINLVDNKVVIEGVLNALQNGKIGGDVYFLSDKGIAVGATGVINAGNLFLGTKGGAATSLYRMSDSKYKNFLDGTTAKKMQILSGSGDITIGGTINTKGDFFAAAKNTTIEATGKIAPNMKFNAAQESWTAEQYRQNFINLDQVENAVFANTDTKGNVYLTATKKVDFQSTELSRTYGGNFNAYAEDTISIKDAFIGTNGGNISLHAEKTVDIKDTMLSTRAVGSSTATGTALKEHYQNGAVHADSGNISIAALRDAHGTTQVNITDSILTAANGRSGSTSYNAGNVDVNAATVTRTYSWAIGMGAEAYVNLTGAKLIGDNVNVAALATTTGELGANAEDITYTDAQIQEGLKDVTTDEDGAVLGLIKDMGAEVRSFVTATKVHAKAKVEIKDSLNEDNSVKNSSELKAQGGTKGDTTTNKKTHGELNLLADARSQVNTLGIGALGYSVSVGISDVNADIIVAGNSKLEAAKDVNLNALGNNNVSLFYLDLSFLDAYLMSNVGVGWAQLASKVHVDVGENTTIIAGQDVNALTKSERTLSNSITAGGDETKVGVVFALGKSDTKAEAALKGNIYVGNKLDVQAVNTISKSEGGIYAADSVSAESMSGDSYFGKPLVSGAKQGLDKIWNKFKGEKFFEPVDKINGKGDGDWGVNAATSVLLSHNTAEAYVNGKVRGLNAGAPSEAVGAKAMTVKAENISRTHITAASYQNKLTDHNGNEINSKDTGVSVTINYAKQDNTTKAHVGGDILVQDDLNVQAETKIPWQSAWESKSATEIMKTLFGTVKDPNLGIGNLADSWSQATATTEKVGLAGAIGIMDYISNSEAYVEGNAKLDVGKKLTVEALNDTTTVNFSGNISSPLTMLPIAIWEGRSNLFKGDMWGSGGETTAIGGAAITVHQRNTAKAYIADSAMEGSTIKGGITAGEVDVQSKNETVNVTVAASGGKSDSVAINGTVSVDRTDNHTEAYIGHANVTTKVANGSTGDVTVDALDESYLINIAGALGASSGSVGIGATIGYNHVDRDTSAYILGNVQAARGVEIAAKNDGNIIAVSLAGSLTYDKTEAEMQNDGTWNTHEMSGELLNVFHDEDDSSSEPLAAMDNLAENTPSSEEVFGEIEDESSNFDEAKNGYAVSANVGINRIMDDAKAYVAKHQPVEGSSFVAPAIEADYVRINASNNSAIDAVYGTISVDLSSGEASGNKSTGIAGSFFYNSVTSTNEAGIADGTLTLRGNKNQDQNNNEIDEALTVKAYNKEKIVNIAASGSIAPTGNNVVGQISVNRVDNKTTAYVDKSNIAMAEKVTVQALDQGKIYAYAGALGLSPSEGGSFGVGASVGAQTIDAETTARVSDTSFVGTAPQTGAAAQRGDLLIDAQEKSTIVSIVATAEAGASDKFVGAFSASGNDINTKTKAYLDTAKAVEVKALEVNATNHADTTVGVGQLVVAGGEGGGIGAGTAVVLSENAVEAYVQGNAGSSSNAIEAASLKVQAENAYNGSADDTNEDATSAKTVVVGGAVSLQSYAGAGSVSVNKVQNTTKAHVDVGRYLVTGPVDVKAVSTAKLFGLAGGVSVAKGVGLGAAVDTQLLDVTTKAYIDNNVQLEQAGAINVEASSYESITSVAATAGVGFASFAGAGAANAHKITTDTQAYIGTDDANDGAESQLGSAAHKVGAVTVSASDDATLKANAGAASVQIGGSDKGGAAGSLSAAVEVLDKRVRASIGRANVQSAGSVDVKATNKGDILTTASGIAGAVTGSGAALTGSASETIVNYLTDAHIAGGLKNTDNTYSSGASINADEDLRVTVDSSFEHTGVATGLAGSSMAGIGLSNDTTVLHNTTKAYAGKNAQLAAGRAIKISAENTTKITSAVVSGGLAIGGVGANGGVGVNSITSQVVAYLDDGVIANAQGSVNNADGTTDSLTIHAKDSTEISGGSGGLGAGQLGGGGASINVNNINKETLAYAGRAANLQSAGASKIEALNDESIYNFTIQGSGGMYAGLAGAVAVHNLDVVTKAYTDTGAGMTSSGDITVQAQHDLRKLTSTAIGVAVAGSVDGVAVTGGAGVDVMNVTTQTNAMLGDDNTITTLASGSASPGTVKVEAKDLLGSDAQKVTSNAVAGGVSISTGGAGAAGISGSVSVLSFGSGMSAEDKKKLNNENGAFDSWLKEQANQSNTKAAMAMYQNSVAQAISSSLETREFSVLPSTSGAAGTLAKIGANTVINAGNIKVNAEDRLRAHTGAGNASVAVVGEGFSGAIGASVGVINSHTKVNAEIANGAQINSNGDITIDAKADHKVASTVVGASVGVSLQGTALAAEATVFSWRDNSDVLAYLGDSKNITAHSLTIHATNTRTMETADNTVVGASVALGGALSGSVIDARVGGSAEACLGNEDGDTNTTQINIAGDAVVNAELNTTLGGKTVAPAVGIFGVAGASTSLTSNGKAKAYVGQGENITARNINVKATATPKLQSEATAAGVGIASVGGAWAKTLIKDEAMVNVANGAELQAKRDASGGGLVQLLATTGKPSSGYNAYADVAAGSGGGLTGVASESNVELNQKTAVNVGDDVIISGKQFTAKALHEDSINYHNTAAAAGGATLSSTETKTKVTSDVDVQIGTDEATALTLIQTDENAQISAENKSTKTWLKSTNNDNITDADQNTLGVGAGALGVAASKNEITITHNTDAIVGSSVKIVANAAPLTVAESNAGLSLADKLAIAIDAHSDIVNKSYQYIGAGAAIGGADINDEVNITANTNATVRDGAQLQAGDVVAAKGTTTVSSGQLTENYAQAATDVGAGSIGIGSRNDADIISQNFITIWGVVGGSGITDNVKYTGQTNTNVGAKVETANGDVRLAAGRDSSGNSGTIKVKGKDDLVNGTVIPVSIEPDPQVTINSNAKLTLSAAGNIASDRDVYLQSSAGELVGKGRGEVKSWVEGIWGSTGGVAGKVTQNKAADVEINGSVETGIHRNQHLTIGGANEQGVWKTQIESSAGVSYDFVTNVGVGNELSARLAELERLRGQYLADPAARAAYDAEIAFIQQKMVDNGLGYFIVGANGEKHFVQYDLGTQSELSKAEEILNKSNNASSSVNSEYQGKIEQNTVQINNCTGVLDKNQQYTQANTAYTAAKNNLATATTNLANAEAGIKQHDSTVTDYDTWANNNKDISNAGIKNLATTYLAAKSTYDSAVTEKNTAATNLTTATNAFSTALQSFTLADGTRYTINSFDAAAATKVNAEITSLTSENASLNSILTSTTANITGLSNQIEATKAFQNAGGTEENGHFYITVNGIKTAVTSYTYAGQDYELLHFATSGLLTNKVTVNDLTARLGDIKVEGDNLYGSGSLNASNQAIVSITNNSPNNLVVNDVKIIGGKNTEQKLFGGADITFNGNNVSSIAQISGYNKDSTKSLAGLQINNKNTNTEAATAPKITIANTFNPNDYPNSESIGSMYAAPTITINESKEIYNPHGSVNISSSYGDIYNYGAINAGSVSMTATNGDFVQGYVAGIQNIGGKPEEILANSAMQGSGITANGNIFISARYVNINGTIQSGISEWQLAIPENPSFYYKNSEGTAISVTLNDIAGWSNEERSSRVIKVQNATGNAVDALRYDAVQGCFVLDGLEVHGGKVQIVGTIINTAKDGAATGKVSALDGYGSITLDNKSSINLSLNNLSTGEGVEGIIEITDLDRATGAKLRTTTYTRNNGQILTNIKTYDANGSLTSDSNAEPSTAQEVIYNPATNQYYIWQTGQDQSIVTKYHYTKADFDIFGRWGTIDKETLQDSIPVESTTSGVYDLSQGTFISDKFKLNDGATETQASVDYNNNYYKQYTYTQTTDVSAPYEVETTSYRVWYTLGTVKRYSTYYKIKVGTTTITQNAIKADNAIGISFHGNESGGSVSVNNLQSDLTINSVLNNAVGSTSLSAQNILQGSNGLIKAQDLTLQATGDVGSLGSGGAVPMAIQTTATELSGSAGKNFVVQVRDNSVQLGNITAGKTADITAAKNITQLDGSVLTAQRIELDAVSGGIGSSVDANGVATGALHIKAGVPTKAVDGVAAWGEANAEYGLKAHAAKDISITNSSDALYLDSVIADAGDVSLTTQGSFVDNNFSDIEDADAIAQVDKWINSQIVAGTEQAAAKQKSMLCSKVEQKYNRYQALKDHINEAGQYVLSDSDRAMLLLANPGMTEADFAAYEAARTEEFASLREVASWSAADVEAYKEAIMNGTAAGFVFADADVQADDARITTDAFLTREEKAEVLVGSTHRMNDLLITFSPGLVKDVTDTNLTIKTTANVQGRSITLKAIASADENASALAKNSNIGSTDTINTNLQSLYEKSFTEWTDEEKDLVRMLATAERGDLVMDKHGNASILMVDAIDVNAQGALRAEASAGNVYLTSEKDVSIDSITAAGEVRLKAAGSLSSAHADSATITSGDRVVLEAAKGSIAGITLVDANPLLPNSQNEIIARAQGDISLAKQGDLYVDTVYSAGGSITLDVSDAASAEDHDILGYMDERNQGDTVVLGYGTADNTNLKAQSITLLGARNLGMRLGENGPEGVELGVFITSPEGRLDAQAQKDASIIVSGGLKNAIVSGENLRLYNDGSISGGSYTAQNDLTLGNTGSISGCLFTGADAKVYNQGSISGGEIIATGTLEMDNLMNDKTQQPAEISGGSISGNQVNITNEAVISGGDINASEELRLNNNVDGAISGGSIASEGELSADNQGRMNDNSLACKNVQLNNSGSLSGAAISSSEDVTLTNSGSLSGISITAGQNAELTSSTDVDLASLSAGGDVLIDVGASLTANTISGGDLSLSAGESITIASEGSVNALENATGADSVPVGEASPKGGVITADGHSKGSDFSVGKGTGLLQSSTGKISINAGRRVAIDTVDVSGAAGGGSLDITANAIGIDDLAIGEGAATELAIKSRQGAAGFVGITKTGSAQLLIKDSQINDMELTGTDNLAVQRLITTGAAHVYTDKLHLLIQNNPNNEYAMLVDYLGLMGYDIVTQDIIANIGDGLTINGEHSKNTPAKVANRSLYSDLYAGKSVDEALQGEQSGQGREQHFARGQEIEIEIGERGDDEEYIIIK